MLWNLNLLVMVQSNAIYERGGCSLNVGVSLKKEEDVNFLTNSDERRSTFRPTHILVYRWVREKHVRVDLTRIFSLVGLRT